MNGFLTTGNRFLFFAAGFILLPLFFMLVRAVIELIFISNDKTMGLPLLKGVGAVLVFHIFGSVIIFSLFCVYVWLRMRRVVVPLCKDLLFRSGWLFYMYVVLLWVPCHFILSKSLEKWYGPVILVLALLIISEQAVMSLRKEIACPKRVLNSSE